MSADPPRDNSVYSRQEYWEERYRKDCDDYEWFAGSYMDFLKHLTATKRLHSSEIYLHVGCGDSQLGRDLAPAGLVVEVDYAESALERLFTQIFEHREGIVADARSCYLRSGIAFDMVIDKGISQASFLGTIDAVFSDGSSPWSPAESTRNNVGLMVQQAHRMLAQSGMFIVMTFGQPHFRLPHMTACGWRSTRALPLGDSFYHVIELEK